MIDLKAIRDVASVTSDDERMQFKPSSVIALLDRLEAAEKALAEPAAEPVGYVRMLNGEPTPDDDGCVFSYGGSPYRDTYGAEEWLPVYSSPTGAAVETVNIQEAWEAAGGNPGIKATKEELLENLRILDQVCDEADSPPPPAEVPLLTDEEIEQVDCSMCGEREFADVFARAIERIVRRNAGLK